MSAPRARTVLFVLGASTALGLVRAASTLLPLRLAAPSDPANASAVLLSELASAWLFALLTPLALRAVRASPLARGRRLRSLARLLGALLVITALHEALFWPVRVRLRDGRLDAPTLASFARRQGAVYANVAFLTGIGLVAALAALESAARARRAAVAAARLEAELASAELERETVGFRPELFFSTLDLVVTRLRERPLEAEDLVVALAEVLRVSSKPGSPTKDGGQTLDEALRVLSEARGEPAAGPATPGGA